MTARESSDIEVVGPAHVFMADGVIYDVDDGSVLRVPRDAIVIRKPTEAQLERGRQLAKEHGWEEPSRPLGSAPMPLDTSVFGNQTNKEQ